MSPRRATGNRLWWYLDNNKLMKIGSTTVKGLKKLEILKLQRNNIEKIDPGAFDDLRELKTLDLSYNNIISLPDNLFEKLSNLKEMKVDHFTLCCYATKFQPGVSCIARQKQGLSSCDALLKNEVLQYAMWILGVSALAGNFIVLTWRVVKSDRNRVSSFLLTNLAVADLLMGVYMIIIAYKNYTWRGVYFQNDIIWRGSKTCAYTGIISTVSSEVSVFMLFLITLDRMICILFPFKYGRLSMKKAVPLAIFAWLLGLLIAFAPLFDEEYFYDNRNKVHFYGRSPVCLPLQLSNDRSAGWEYSVIIFLAINGISFFFMLVAYILMFRYVQKSSRATRSTRIYKNSALAKRMLFIILTDFFCWFPVIVMSIISLVGHLDDPNQSVYAWVAVFVLPINSSINPLLYTLSTEFFLGRLCERTRRRVVRELGTAWHQATTEMHSPMQ